MIVRKTPLFFLIVMLNIAAMVFMVIRPEFALVLICMTIWIDMVAYCLSNIQKRIFLFAFLLSFFVFLMGREILDTFGLHKVVTSFPDEVNAHAERLLIISLLSLFCGYVLSDHIVINGSNAQSLGHDDQYYETLKMKTYRTISLYVFYGSMIFSAVALVHIGLFIIRHGYYATYTSYSGLPWIIEKLSDLTPIAFFLFLATMPEKKQVNKHSIVFVVYLAMTLMSGKRFTFVAGFLILMAYYIKRNSINSGGMRWLTKKTIIIIAACIPVVFVLLYIFGTARFLESSGGLSFRDSLTDFLYGQGVSIHVIKFSYQHEYNPDRLYSFSSTMTFLQKNFVARLLGIKSYSGNTVENALYGYSLGHANSYYVYGSRYLAGKGTGSCYIAEAFHDFSYFGVVIFNFIYGIVLNRSFRFEKMGVIGCTISLILLQSLLLAPRGSADGFVSDIVDVTTWAVFILVFGFSNLVSKTRSTSSLENCGSTNSSQ